MSTPSSAPAQTIPTSKIAGGRALFGCHPDDVLMQIRIGVDTLDQAAALFGVIEDQLEPDGKHTIQKLCAIGRYLCEDISNLMDCCHEKFAEQLNAAQAREGGAA